MTEIIERINEILKLDIDDNSVLDIFRSDLINRFLIDEYGWEAVQNALFDILVEGNKTEDEYAVIGCVFLDAIDANRIIEKDKAVALINYRLNPFDSPYEDNTAWSVTSLLYKLDYANSEYNAFRDKKILTILKECGLIEEKL